MASRIEDYAIIGDCETAALVGRDGSIDWLCFPRFDSAACFAALLGDSSHGRWLLAPDLSDGTRPTVHRRYLGDSLVLETEFHLPGGGVAAVIDFMPVRDGAANLIRIVEGRGSAPVPMCLDLVIRFDYGSIVPWVQRIDPCEGEAAHPAHTSVPGSPGSENGNAVAPGVRELGPPPSGPSCYLSAIWAIGGPDSLRFRSSVPIRNENFRTTARFTLRPGQRHYFSLTWHTSYDPPPRPVDPEAALARTCAWWLDWARQCTYRGPWREAVMRSLITLKALTYAPSGGIAAAATTSLPEHIGGVRNWDYRFCWLRDATLALNAMVQAGYIGEARAWRNWLLRAVAGIPAETQIMYGLTGERRLTEHEIPWLPGYEGSSPVRIGNAASSQFQLDVYGEVLDALYQARRANLEPSAPGWELARALIEFVEQSWERPDEGIWEVRGPRRHFTHSKVMAWVAVDRGIKAVEQFGRSGPVERWRRLRDQIHEQVCREGFNTALNSFVQSYGSSELDASLLTIPLVGFLPPEDPRVRGTVAAIERQLVHHGFVRRYDSHHAEDGLPPGEGTFLACSFWLADNLYLTGRHDEARDLFERLLAIRNDVGLLAEEYDPVMGRQLGNFPQAFSHLGLINTAFNLSPGEPSPAEERPEHHVGPER